MTTVAGGRSKGCVDYDLIRCKVHVRCESAACEEEGAAGETPDSHNSRSRFLRLVMSIGSVEHYTERGLRAPLEGACGGVAPVRRCEVAESDFGGHGA